MSSTRSSSQRTSTPRPRALTGPGCLHLRAHTLMVAASLTLTGRLLLPQQTFGALQGLEAPLWSLSLSHFNQSVRTGHLQDSWTAPNPRVSRAVAAALNMHHSSKGKCWRGAGKRYWCAERSLLKSAE
ncbi:hypothetical protein O3P69_002453 [Scylla paramamosain]|uniref:Uncharacterized protein n=1 Tax=Scylla paramamosain TaxID=85552 RepID=A0AAW0UN72_SCYPA